MFPCFVVDLALTQFDQTNFQIVYGIKVLPKGDPYITLAEEALSTLSKAGNPGVFLVDTAPICTSGR
jgi:hypothetical protein